MRGPEVENGTPPGIFYKTEPEEVQPVPAMDGELDCGVIGID